MSFNTPNSRRRGSIFDEDDPLFSSAIMDTTTGAIAAAAAARTPTQRGLSLEPPPSSRQSLQTPSNNFNPLRSSLRSSVHRTPGLSASGRRSRMATTPHARAAFRTIDQRRAAALTPGGKKRRESFRPRRESIHDVLRGLSRVTKHNTNVISSSSSPSEIGGQQALPIRTAANADRSLMYEDDDDDELPIDRPRLSLPLDVDDDDDLVPPRLSEMDENATIEFSRRAYTEQPSRLSMGSVRMGEYRDYGDLSDDDDDDDGGAGFAPFDVGDLDEGGREQEDTFDRIENDPTRRETLASARESDIGFQVPIDADQTTFVMNVEGQSSPAHPLPEITNEQPSLHIAPSPVRDDQPPLPFGEDPADFGPYNDLRSSSPEDYTATGPVDMTNLNVQEDADATDEEGADASAHVDQRAARKPSKRGLKLSRYGMQYPSLPSAVVKRLAGTCAKSSGITKTKISADVLAEIQRASDWFFEQLGDDLAAYAKHAKRKTIDESDMLTLMRRQRQTNNSTTTPFSLAQRHLPRELLQELRMPKPPPVAEPKKKRRVNGGGGEEEVT